MERNDRLICKTFRGVLIVQTVSLISAICAILIDAIVIGRFLGSDSVAAMGLIQPVVWLMNLIGTLFGPGLSIVCTRYTGMVKLERVREVFSLVMITIATIAITVVCIVFVLSPSLADLLGAKTNDPELIRMISNYLRGYCFGMPFMMLSMVLTGLMMLDNHRKLGVAAVLTTLISDTVLDLLNVIVFHGGMRGMAIATSLSNIAGFLVLLTHFLRKERILRFQLSGLNLLDLKEIVLNSVPNGLSTASVSIRNLFFNTMILAIATKVEVSALSVTNSSFTLVTAVTLSLNLATSTISSLFYGEEDRRGIEVSFRESVKAALLIFMVILLIFVTFANVIAKCFLSLGNMDELNTAAFFIRCMTIQYFLMCVSYSFTGIYQGTRHLRVSNLLLILRETVYPVVCVAILGLLFGVRGVGAGFILAGVLSLLTCILIPVFVKRKLPIHTGDFVLLADDFGSDPDDTFEASVSDLEGAMDASEKAMVFCRKHELPNRLALFISLFIEEMLRNVMEHGYADGQERNADIRVICGKDRQIIRLRDNGKSFDPVEWHKKNHPESPESGFGIRMVVALAKDFRYVPAMDLNNVMLTL